MDQRKCVDQRSLVSSCDENTTEFKEEEDNDDEALSLSDLPLIHHWRTEKEEEKDKNSPPGREGVQEEFDFCCVSKEEAEICAADEVFFQGQILPLRRLLSPEKGVLQHYGDRSLSISRLDHSTTSGGSSCSSSKYKPSTKLPPRNHLHSHPSPSPRLHFPTAVNHKNSIKKSSIWNVLRLGLVSTPPEIAFHHLKERSSNSGSRSSSSSKTSSISSGSSTFSVLKKMRPRLLGRCKCAADDVAPRVVVIKRNASEGDMVALNDEINQVQNGDAHKVKKKHMSHHRTFEWLKQLTVEADEA